MQGWLYEYVRRAMLACLHVQVYSHDTKSPGFKSRQLTLSKMWILYQQSDSDPCGCAE